jgi:pre-mRNA-splicing factor CDC5/CEF1
MRVLVKGGPWKNTEDEVLKAAVMKYGKNQWARVASLLNRKSPKQCKARWYEWIDPSIKKTEWTREEEEKLLHLAKLFPTQWKTIAPIVGRTATQCLEHYERLLDEAQGRDKEFEDSEDPRKLRAGEIDTQPESKPPRPDAVDLDEDEKEMLSEARARLANTKGKKAKRKAREKQLEEARRASALQKKREMKAAGIHVDFVEKKKKVKGGPPIDYNKEIPFHKKPITGFYDTSEEKSVSMGRSAGIINKTLEEMEGKRKSEVEMTLRKEDKEKLKKRKQDPNTIPLEFSDSNPASKRVKISLPTPQLQDEELEEIGKASSKESTLESGTEVTSKLLNNYQSTPKVSNTPMRTPSTASGSSSSGYVDNVRLQAENLAKLTRQQTPLQGGENVHLNEKFQDFQGSTPSRVSISTPNPLIQASPKSTVGSGGVHSTPLRDQFNLNFEISAQMNELSEKKRKELLKQQLKQSFSSLPKPENDDYYFQVNKTQLGESDSLVEDAEDVLKRKKREKEEKKEIEMKKKSKVFQRKLPNPKSVREIEISLSNENSPIEELILDEMLLLMYYDEFKDQKLPPLEDFKLSELNHASTMLTNEQSNFKGISLEEFSKIWEKNFKFEQQKDHLDYFKEEETKISKLENKLKILTGGLSKRTEKLEKEIQNEIEEMNNLKIQLETYLELYKLESVAIPKRKMELKELIEIEKEKQSKLQYEYSLI